MNILLQNLFPDSSESRDVKYNAWARNQPTFFCLILPIALIFFLLAKDFFKEENGQIIIYIVNGLTALGFVVPALFFTLRAFIREFSKLIELCVWGVYKPTTYLFTKSKILSAAQKRDIIERVKTEFKIEINLSDIKSKEERKQLDYAVSQIRNTDRCRADNILFEELCIYGFFRNLAAAIVLNILLIVSLLIFNPFVEYQHFLWILLYCYSTFLVIDNIAIFRSGKRYATKLYDTYLKKL